MLIPHFWARAEGAATDPRGKRYDFQLWGWSSESRADALENAKRRVAELVARVARGEWSGSYLYGVRPLREEIVRTHGESGSPSEVVITRNRYGALVLNTARVPFIDIDSPTVGPLTRLAQLFRRRSSRVDPGLERVRDACSRNGRHSFRIYRTRAGHRVLVTSLLLDPSASGTEELLSAFDADPAFTKLCKLQGSFRARLTPKPWRIGCSLPPGRHPREGAALTSAYATWLSKYEAASRGFASCKYLETVGTARPVAEARGVVEEHDRTSRALSDLPLA